MSEFITQEHGRSRAAVSNQGFLYLLRVQG